MKIFDHYKGLSKEVYIVAFSRFVNTLGAFIWPLFVMILKTKIGMDDGAIALFITFSMILGMASGLLGGFLADKFGRKIIIVIFEFIGILSFLSIAFIPMGMTVAYVMLFGQIMWNISGPAHESLMANITKTEERESAFSLIYLMLNLGVVVGPAVGGMLLAEHFQLFILIDVFTSFVSFLLFVFLVHEKPEKISQNEFENAVKVPIIKMLKQRPVVFMYGLLMVATSFTYGQLDLTLPLYVERLFGELEGPKIFGFMYSLNGLTVVLFVSVITYLLRHKSGLSKLGLGYTFYLITFSLLAFNESKMGLFLLMIFFTWGEIIISIGAGPILSKIVPENQLARVSAFYQFFYIAGHGVATLLTGWLLEMELPFKTVWLTVTAIGLVGLLYYFYFMKKNRKVIEYVDAFDKNRSMI